MYEKSFHLEIVAPDRMVFTGNATSLTAPGILGMFQVLFNHAPLLAELSPGPLTVKDSSGADTLFAVGGGFVEVRDNRVVVLADSVEPASDIDVARARAAQDRAVQLLHERAPETDLAAAESALRRAQNRLKVAQRR